MALMTSGATMMVHLADDVAVDVKTTPFGRVMMSFGTNDNVNLTVFMDEHQVRQVAAALVDWLHAADMVREASEARA